MKNRYDHALYFLTYELQFVHHEALGKAVSSDCFLNNMRKGFYNMMKEEI